MSQLDAYKQLIISRDKLEGTTIDIGGRDIVVGFNEPKLKESNKLVSFPDLDSKLNARLASYFLPAVLIANQQKERPRLMIISAIIAALKWNATTEEEQKIVTINNNLKIEFLKQFFSRFFPDSFSIVEFAVMQDIVKIEEKKIADLWELIVARFPSEIADIRAKLLAYQPHISSVEDEKDIDDKLADAFKYAIIHLFGTGDVNFEGNYIHNPVGYASVGGQREIIFNRVRYLACEVLRNNPEAFFGRDVLMPDNIRIVVETEEDVPPPYSGYSVSTHGKRTLDEVTFENRRDISFYDTHPKLHWDMDFLYQYVNKKAYADFWNEFSSTYFDLKQRYREAYKLERDM